MISFSLMDLGKQMRLYRAEHELTQKQLSEKVEAIDGSAKLSQREISNLEKGKGNPTLNKLLAIAEVLGKVLVLQDIKE